MELIIPLVIIGAIALAVFGYYQAAQRCKAIAAWAAANGLRFEPGSDHRFDDRFAGFSCLGKGSNRYAHNIMHGSWRSHDDRRLTAFDYHYATYSTDSKGRRRTHHHHFSAVVIHTLLPLTPLFIRPEGFFDKVTEFFGYDDIDFESAEFSRRFHVKSSDKQWAFDVIHQATMEFILAAPRYTLQFAGREIIAYNNSRFSASEFESAIAVIEGILDRLPQYLLNDLAASDKGS
jgi:hypothetical protein